MLKIAQSFRQISVSRGQFINQKNFLDVKQLTINDISPAIETDPFMMKKAYTRDLLVQYCKLNQIPHSGSKAQLIDRIRRQWGFTGIKNGKRILPISDSQSRYLSSVGTVIFDEISRQHNVTVQINADGKSVNIKGGADNLIKIENQLKDLLEVRERIVKLPSNMFELPVNSLDAFKQFGKQNSQTSINLHDQGISFLFSKKQSDDLVLSKCMNFFGNLVRQGKVIVIGQDQQQKSQHFDIIIPNDISRYSGAYQFTRLCMGNQNIKETDDQICSEQKELQQTIDDKLKNSQISAYKGRIGLLINNSQMLQNLSNAEMPFCFHNRFDAFKHIKFEQQLQTNSYQQWDLLGKDGVYQLKQNHDGITLSKIDFILEINILTHQDTMWKVLTLDRHLNSLRPLKLYDLTDINNKEFLVLKRQQVKVYTARIENSPLSVQVEEVTMDNADFKDYKASILVTENSTYFDVQSILKE